MLLQQNRKFWVEVLRPRILKSLKPGSNPGHPFRIVHEGKAQNLLAPSLHTGFICLPSSSSRSHVTDTETGLFRPLCDTDIGICVPKGVPFPSTLGTFSQSCDTLVKHTTPGFRWNGVLGVGSKCLTPKFDDSDG